MLAKAFCCLGTGLFSGRQAKMVGKPTVVAGATTTIPIPGNEFKIENDTDEYEGISREYHIRYLDSK